MTNLNALADRVEEARGGDAIRRYVEMRTAKPLGKLDDIIHGVHTGTEWEAELRLSDLRLLLDEVACLRARATGGSHEA